MNWKYGLIIFSVILIIGCAAKQKSESPAKVESSTAVAVEEEKLESIDSKENYHVWKYQGRLYVIGSDKINESFQKHKHMPYTKTILGLGIEGETVVFEVNKKDSTFADRLISIYKERNPIRVDAEENYNVWKYNGRIYVIGSDKVNETFKKHKHMPYTKTILGLGPAGETVIFEVNKKDPAFAEQLIEKYNSKPYLVTSSQNYFVWKYNGRIYVIGSTKTNDTFVKHKHMPYTKTILGLGPGGETVIFEVNKKDAAFTEKLINQYKMNL